MVQEEKLYELLKKTFGFTEFRLEQKKIISHLLEDKDTLAIMPTGGGKSLCYQLPALYKEGLTLVVSPLISLMQDQARALKALGVEVRFWNSSLSYEEKSTLQKELKEGHVKLLYLAPEGILQDSLLSLLKALEISLIAIDEAHCVSQWGHEFRSDYVRLGELKEHFQNVPTIALTATADELTRNDIIEQLQLKAPKTFLSSFDRANIRYEILEKENETRQLTEFIKTHHPNDVGIVYCLSRKKVESVTQELCKQGFNAVPYHAGLDPQVRAKNQSLFDREEKLIVVATIAFGMGIDRPDVRFVAHLDLPKSVEGYYQETGRAGRDGESASAWMVYGLQDVVKLGNMIEMTEASENYKKSARHKLDQMLTLCETTHCRRHYLLRYFGEQREGQCGNCDSCLNPPKLWDATIDVQKMLSAIFRTGQMFGVGHIIDVLRGSQNERVKSRGHHELSVYGLGGHRSKSEWSAIARQLLHLDYIKIKDWDYKTLALTEKCRPILKNQEKVLLRELRKAEKIKGSGKNSAKAFTDHDHPELFASLRLLRKKLSEEEGVPPYIVFSDKSLHDMCALLPRNRPEMLMAHGVGESKFERYGDVFLKSIEEFNRTL